MKKAIIALSAMLCVMACREKPAAKQEQAAETPSAVAAPVAPVEKKTPAVVNLWLITPNAVGIFQKGEPIPFDNKDYVFKEKSIDFGEGPIVHHEVYQGGEKILEIYSHGSIAVLSSKFATDKGIGVGSTIEELRKAYPKAEAAGANPEGLDEFYIDTEGANRGFRATFSHDDFSNKNIDPYDAKITDLKKGAKIKQMVLL